MKKDILHQEHSTWPRCLFLSVISWTLITIDTPAQIQTNVSSNFPAFESQVISVTARGRDVPVSKTPGSIGIIPQDEIREREAVGLANVMELVPGVSKTSDSTWGSDVNIRGLSRESVILLIDGCRVNTATDINAQFGLIDPMDIERIEILKGPISSLYGSGSIGGVVNVITRKGRFSAKPELTGRFAGDYMNNPGGPDAYGCLNFNSPDFYAYLSQGYHDHTSYEDGNGDEVHNSQFRDSQTALKLGERWNEWHTTEAQVQWFDGRNIGVPGSGNAPLPVYADVTYPRIGRRLFQLQHTFTPDNPVLEKSFLNLYYQYIERRVLIDNFPPAALLLEVTPGADHDTVGATWQNTLALYNNHHTVIGLDLWQRQLDAFRTQRLKSGKVVEDQPLPNAKFTSGGLFTEDDWDLTDVMTINSGVRVDGIYVENDSTAQWQAQNANDIGWNAHLGGTYALTETLSMKLIGAHGYRAATLEERYAYLELGGGKTKWGNPDLDPEQSTLLEYGFQWTSKSWIWSLSTYYNRLENLIADQVVNSNTIVSANIKQAEIYGAEGESRYIIMRDWQVYGNLAWSQGNDTKTGAPLPNIAPFNGLAGVRYENPRHIWAYVEMKLSAAQHEVPSGIDPAADWQCVNARIGYDFSCRRTTQRVFAGVDNVFNQAYHDYLTTARGYAFNEPGRSLSCGYQLSF